MSSELLHRCRAFVLRTQGAWSREARVRLQEQLDGKGLQGPVDTVLEALREERAEDAVYVCTGSSCRQRPLPEVDGDLPVREVACLGGCRLAPCAHRVQDGVGHTHVALDESLLDELVAGQDTGELRRRRWAAGELFVDLGLAPLEPFVGLWTGAGGFVTPGCVRTMVARWVLGGRFLELELENAWPTVAGGVDRYAERLTLQSDGRGSFTGVYLDYRGVVQPAEAWVDGARLVVHLDLDASRRRVFELDGNVLHERHERKKGDGWTTGFEARLGDPQAELRRRQPVR